VLYRLLGRSGLRVSELALGTMTFGEDWGWGASPAECGRMLDRYGEAGGNFIDTAGNYTDGSSERIVGEVVAADRDRWVIATKYTLTSRRDDPNAGGNHRKSLVRSLEASLRRLGTDRVDLLWLHMWDQTTPVEEVMRALDDQVRAGKVLHVGFSDTPAWVVSRGLAVAELRGWTPPVAVQMPWSLADREVEHEHLPMAAALDLAVTPWGLLEGGSLTGKYLAATAEAGEEAAGAAPGRAPEAAPRRHDADGVSERVNRIATEVVAVAAEVGRPPAQVAINWVRGRDHGCVVVPVIGARDASQLGVNLGCLEFELEAAQVERLDAASGFRPGFQRSFLDSDEVRGLIFGDTFARIRDHRATLARSAR
jgi:aryl-alcohol dehydrogenase-like predicted oxidoreductase